MSLFGRFDYVRYGSCDFLSERTTGGADFSAIDFTQHQPNVFSHGEEFAFTRSFILYCRNSDIRQERLTSEERRRFHPPLVS